MKVVLISILISFSSIVMCSDKDLLKQDFEKFKSQFEKEMYFQLRTGATQDVDGLISLIKRVITTYSTTDEARRYVLSVLEDFVKSNDLLSIFLLLFWFFDYIPDKEKALVVRFMVIIQSMISEAIQQHDPSIENVLQLTDDKLKKLSKTEKEKLVKEVNEVLGCFSGKLKYQSIQVIASQNSIVKGAISLDSALLFRLPDKWF